MSADTKVVEAHALMKSRLIGAVLIEKGLITGEQLDVALELQAKTGERLGEIVVAEFGISRLELAGVLAEQWAELDAAGARSPSTQAPELKIVEPLTPDEVQIRRPIGEIFVELGFIDSDELEAALTAQRETGARIGEILVEQGSLSRLDLASALAEQWSALQKLRPPAPVAEPQPWQNGSPVAPSGGQVRAIVDDATLANLEERLRLIEHAATIPTTQEDLDRVQLELRAALGALEARVEVAAEVAPVEGIADSVDRLAARLDAFESSTVSADVAALRGELEELRADPGLADALADVVAAVERLERRPDRADELERLSIEIASLTVRLDGLAGLDELTDRIDEAAGQARSAETGVRDLAHRLETLAALESRLDDIAARIPAEGVLDDLRTELSELGSAREAALADSHEEDIGTLAARVDELAARYENVAAATEAELAPRIDVLSSRLDELVVETSMSHAEDLASRLESLEERSRKDDDALSRLASEVEDLGTRTHARLDGVLERRDDAADLEDLRSQIGVLSDRNESIGILESQLGAFETRIAELPAAAELRDEMRQIEAAVESLAGLESGVSAGIDRAVTKGTDPLIERLDSAESKLDGLADLEARLVEMAAELERQPGERLVGELAEVRSQLEELAASPDEDVVVRERVDSIATRLEAFGSLESGLVEAREQIAAAEAVRVADALAHGARLAGVEASAASSGDALAELDGRLSAVERDLELQSDNDALASDVADLRAQIDHLATRAAADELGQRVSELADRAEAIASDAGSSLTRSSDELSGRIDELVFSLDVRTEELNKSFQGLVAREDLDAAAARHVEWFQAELASVREGGDQRLAILEASVANVDRARETDRHASRSAMDESLGAVRSELQLHHDALASQLQSQLVDHRSELDLAHAEREAERAARSRLESLLEQGLAALSARVTDEVAGARTTAELETEIVRGEAAGLRSRIDEILGMRYVDLQAGRLADERLAEQLDAVAELREDDAEVARRGAADLSSRLDGVAGALQADTAALRETAEGVDSQLGELHRQLEDLAVAGLAGAELAARLDDLVSRTAKSAAEVEHAVRSELESQAARFEEYDGAAIEAREELRGELERLASSMGWRLERIEESLATDDSAVVRATLEELERRLEGQSALGEEQARATERALRKGLASLGERLVDSESAYAEAGNTLRRSIERLGAAVVEADARMADQIPVSPLEGYVAFAPTADGYRLVELPGVPPEIGATVELKISDAPLVVTRYGRSPLPFDARACAYLDRP